MRTLFLGTALMCLNLPAFATDWLVDASGTASNLTTIAQAMAQVSTGDRILVLPGSYPAFHFSRSVDVIGLGASPDDVLIQRVDFHPTIPTLGYDAGIANVRVCGDSFSISGNELAAGTFVIDGAHLCGGVFLHGAGQLYVLMQNSQVEAGPGDGFLGAAFDFGGGSADIVNSSIRAASASSAGGTTAGIGLRIWSTSTSNVRISNSLIRGGTGVDVAGFRDGGDAIDRLSGGTTSLRLSGGSQILGGSAAGAGHGGNAVDIAGTITTGLATVTGGIGATPGATYASSQPTALGFDPLLRFSPTGTAGSLPVFQHPGELIRIDCDPSLTGALLASSTQIDPPTTPTWSPLTAPQLLGGPSEGFVLPVRSHRVVDPAPRRRVYLQGLFVDPLSGQTHSTNPIAMTVDP
ncbi:MAG: hypothetical protein IPJ77_09975 [Planctomycetes bacterium]|nr:hypothetical protein [Planctomycetota bacterium]